MQDESTLKIKYPDIDFTTTEIYGLQESDDSKDKSKKKLRLYFHGLGGDPSDCEYFSPHKSDEILFSIGRKKRVNILDVALQAISYTEEKCDLKNIEEIIIEGVSKGCDVIVPMLEEFKKKGYGDKKYIARYTWPPRIPSATFFVGGTGNSEEDIKRVIENPNLIPQNTTVEINYSDSPTFDLLHTQNNSINKRDDIEYFRSFLNGELKDHNSKNFPSTIVTVENILIGIATLTMIPVLLVGVLIEPLALIALIVPFVISLYAANVWHARKNCKYFTSKNNIDKKLKYTEKKISFEQYNDLVTITNPEVNLNTMEGQKIFKNKM